MLHNKLIKNEDINNIFNTLASEYNKLGGTKQIELYLVGGAAILLSFKYRMSTIDIDALFKDDELLAKAIKNVSIQLNLPEDWLNHDFISTPSYSDKIPNKAELYSNYQDLIFVYTLKPKYMIAMKLKSSRPTGGDLDDVIKMIYELRYNNEPISYDEIIEAYKELYNDFSNTYSYFLDKTKEAFETPVEDFEYMFKKY